MRATLPERRRRWRRRVGLGVLFGALLSLALLGATELPPGSAAQGNPPISSNTPSAGSGPGIAVSPEAWTMVAGDSVRLESYLLNPMNGCVAGAALFTWSLEGTGDLYGYLNASSGAHERFTSFAFESGTAVVNASLLGLELCPNGWRTFTASVPVEIRVVPPITLDRLVLSPNPATSRGAVTLTALVQGGEPPYRASFQYGDGSSESVSTSGAGAVTVVHRYLPGSYLPRVDVRDGLAERISANATEPLLVSTQVAVAIDAPTLSPDVGVPILLVAHLLPNQPLPIVWNDTEGHHATGPGWWLNLSSPGPDRVTATAWGPVDPAGNASVDLLAQPPVGLSVAPGNGTVDLGQAVHVSARLTGGSAPFRVEGTTEPAGSQFDLSGVSSRSVTAVLVPASAGEMWARVTVTDALGARASESEPVAFVVRVPSLTVNLSPNPAEVGTPLRLVGEATGGVPPFDWTIATTADLGRATPLAGSVDGAGVFAWTGNATSSGPAEFRVRIVDATGMPAEANLTVPLLPALSLAVDPLPVEVSSGHALAVGIEVAGGVRPYDASFLLSDGELHLVNASLVGVLAWSAAPSSPGPLRVTVTVSDRAGAMARWEQNVTVAPSSSGVPPGAKGPSPPSAGNLAASFASGFGAAAGLGLVVLIGWRLHRRGRTKDAEGAAGPSPQALLTIRRLVQENAPVDRETLLLLAEEEGLDPDEAGAALRTWEGRGRLRREGIGGGESVYRWSVASATETAPAADGARGEGAP